MSAETQRPSDLPRITEPDPDLDLNVDAGFQRREWRWQRIGWVVIGLILVGALLGVFANGPLSHESARSPDGQVRVVYQRFARHDGVSSIGIQVQPAAARHGQYVLTIGGDWAQAIQIEDVVPQPSTWTSRGGAQILEFDSADPQLPLQVEVDYHADTVGWHPGQVGVVGADPAQLGQFMYP